MSDFFAPAPEPSTPLGRFRILSPRAGVRVSPFALGGMSFGKAWEGFMGSMDKEGTFKLLDGFHEAGGNFIDTANNYQNEESELWIGEWIEKNGLRDQFVIATKYTTNYKAYEIGKNPSRNLTGNHKKSLKTSLRDSLKKLRTDYVDILYLHWWDFTTSIEEIMDSLHNEVVAGRVLYLGVSDTPAWIVAACNTYATAHGKTPFVVYQGRWNVMIRDLEREIIPMCRQFGMAITPWDAIGGGRLQSKKQMEAKKQAGEGIRAMMGGAEQTEDEVKYSQVLTEIAEKHGLESPTVVALAYVMNKAPYVFPIVGGRKVEHLKENIKAITLKLTDEEIKQIEDIKPFDPSFPHNFIGPDPHFHELGAFVKGQIGTVDFVKGPYSL